MAKGTRRYSIQITDIDTERDVLLTAVDCTADELRTVVQQGRAPGRGA